MIEYIPSWMIQRPLISYVANLRVTHLDNTKHGAYAELSPGDVLLLTSGKIGIVLCPYSKNSTIINGSQSDYFEHIMLIQ